MIRLLVGIVIEFGILNKKSDIFFIIVYIMIGEKCINKCSFCF